MNFVDKLSFTLLFLEFTYDELLNVSKTLVEATQTGQLNKVLEVPIELIEVTEPPLKPEEIVFNINETGIHSFLRTFRFVSFRLRFACSLFLSWKKVLSITVLLRFRKYQRNWPHIFRQVKYSGTNISQQIPDPFKSTTFKRCQCYE